MKKIKITVKDADNLEFYINESANKDDYICIKDIMNINIKEVQDFFVKNNLKAKEELKKKIRNEEKENWENEFKTSEEYLQLLKSKKEWENKIENEKNIIKLELEKEYEIKISNLTNKLEEIKKEKDNEKQNEILKIKCEHLTNINKQKDKYEQEIKELTTEIETLKRLKKGNSKIIGEEFEIWIINKINEMFSFDRNVKIEKITKSIDVGENKKEKADFLFKVFKNSELIGNVIIEAKTKANDANTSKKNKDHFAKLYKAYLANKSSFCILVTELEPEDEFSIRPIKEYENMYMVRPEYINIMLSLTKIIILKQAAINKVDFNFKERQKILEEFKDFKDAIINNSIKHIKNNIDKIIKMADDIYKNANVIKEEANKVINTHLNRIESKINNFNIEKKVIKNIENIEDDNIEAFTKQQKIENYK